MTHEYQNCPHGLHLGWCIDCLRKENERDRIAFESMKMTCEHMLDPTRRGGPSGKNENVSGMQEGKGTGLRGTHDVKEEEQ